MPLGPPPPSKSVVEEHPLDLANMGNRKNDEGPERSNLFNNQMAPIGQSVVFSLYRPLSVA